MCDINTTPLIDVMLVLLVTLIVTLPIMTHAVKLDMPPPNPNQPPPPVQPEIINLEIYYDGTIAWNGADHPDRSASWRQQFQGGGGQGSAAGVAPGARQSREVRRGRQGAGGGAAQPHGEDRVRQYQSVRRGLNI